MNYFKVSILFAGALFLTACQTPNEVINPIVIASITTLTDSEFSNIVIPMGKGLIENVIKGNNEVAFQNCTKELQVRMLNAKSDPKIFESQFGKLKNIQYLGDFKQDLMRTALFKVSFDYKTSNGKISVREIPGKIVFAEEKGVIKIFAFSIAPF